MPYWKTDDKSFGSIFELYYGLSVIMYLLDDFCERLESQDGNVLYLSYQESPGYNP